MTEKNFFKRKTEIGHEAHMRELGIATEQEYLDRMRSEELDLVPENLREDWFKPQNRVTPAK